MEIVGYVARTLSASKSIAIRCSTTILTRKPTEVDPYNVIFFVLQYFFIVVAPVFFSASIYTILSVLINHLPQGRQISPLPPKVILGIFISCDVVATVVQIVGAALVGSAESNRKDPRPANHTLLGGLAFQVFTFLIFLIITHIFLYRARKYISCNTVARIKALRAEATSTTANSDVEDAAATAATNEAIGVIGWDFLWAFNIATLAIYLRTCFRLAETAQGLQEFLMTHEVFFGCLEFAPVVIAVFAFNGWHPGRCLPRRAD